MNMVISPIVDYHFSVNYRTKENNINDILVIFPHQHTLIVERSDIQAVPFTLLCRDYTSN